MTVREFARKVFGGQWPILVVGLIFVAAFGLVVAGYWRRGALVLAIGVGVAAAFRLALPDRLSPIGFPKGSAPRTAWGHSRHGCG